jgi:hypothetical protein
MFGGAQMEFGNPYEQEDDSGENMKTMRNFQNEFQSERDAFKAQMMQGVKKNAPLSGTMPPQNDPILSPQVKEDSVRNSQ